MFMINNFYRVVPIEKYVPRIDLNVTYLDIKWDSKNNEQLFTSSITLNMCI